MIPDYDLDILKEEGVGGCCGGANVAEARAEEADDNALLSNPAAEGSRV